MGSSRPPKRLLVLRTPLATARIFPRPADMSVTMRSASPSRIVRSTMPWSRYSRLTASPLSPVPDPLDPAEPAVPALVLAHRVEQVFSPEVGPEGGGEHELAVGELPQEEVGDPELPRGADDQVRVRNVGQVQAGPDGTFVDPGCRDALCHHPSHGIDDLGAAA